MLLKFASSETAISWDDSIIWDNTLKNVIVNFELYNKVTKGLKFALLILHCTTLPTNYNSTNERNNVKGSPLNSLFNVILMILAK